MLAALPRALFLGLEGFVFGSQGLCLGLGHPPESYRGFGAGTHPAPRAGETPGIGKSQELGTGAGAPVPFLPKKGTCVPVPVPWCSWGPAVTPVFPYSSSAIASLVHPPPARAAK